MTHEQREAARELLYIGAEIAEAMVNHPDKTARQIAGDARDPDDEIARFVRAIIAARKVLL